MSVRPVELGDAEAWSRLRHALFGDTVEAHARDIERFFAGTAAEPAAVLLAEQEGEVVGLVELSVRVYAEGCKSEGVGYLEGWYVEPSSRGKGIGRELVEAAERWALTRGCTEFASDAALENEGSLRAHVACGFEEVNVIRCFRKSLAAAGPTSQEAPPED